MAARTTDENAPLLQPASPSEDDALSQSDDSATLHTSLTLRIAAAMYSFVVLGFFVSSIGVMLQPISEQFGLSDLKVSFIFIVGPVGYIVAAQSNFFIHAKLGQRGIAIIGPLFHCVAAVLTANHQHFSVTLVGFTLIAIGCGFLDGSWCAWAGNMEKANAVSGLLHGAFSVGAAAGPFIAGTMMARGRAWYEWYYVLLAVSISELIILPYAFRYEDARKYHQDKGTQETHGERTASRRMLRYPALWYSAAYFLADVGAETAMSGWIVSFMARERHTTFYFASLTATGFWAGMAIGRLVLGTVTDRVGVGRATAYYLLIVMLCEGLFILIPVPAVSIVAITLTGFFSGPLFPSGIVVLTRLLPTSLHIASVSFVASIGQVGAAVMPFGIGALIDAIGIGLLQYALLVLAAFTLLLWMLFSRLQPHLPAAQHMQS